MTEPCRTGLTKKRQQQKEIELLTLDFQLNGGQITELRSDNVQSSYKPAWTQYQSVAFADAHGEDQA